MDDVLAAALTHGKRSGCPPIRVNPNPDPNLTTRCFMSAAQCVIWRAISLHDNPRALPVLNELGDSLEDARAVRCLNEWSDHAQ